MKNFLTKIKNKVSTLIAKTSFIATSIMLGTYMPVYASEQGIVTGSSDTIFKNFIGQFLNIATYVGVGLLAYGAFAFFMAMRNEEGEKKTQAIYSVVAGIGIIGIKAILKAIGVAI